MGQASEVSPSSKGRQTIPEDEQRSLQTIILIDRSVIFAGCRRRHHHHV